MEGDASNQCHGVLVGVSTGYPADKGKLLTRYAPLRRSPSRVIANPPAAPRLACVKPAASVHPEPGSNSSMYNILYFSAYPATYNITKKLTLLDKLYFLGTCFLYSKTVFSMNFSFSLARTRFSNGAAKVRIFFESARLL